MTEEKVIPDDVEQDLEMVVWINDVTHENPQFDLQQFKRGHVIEVRPAGVPWGKSTLTNPNWRVIKTFMSIIEAAAFLTTEKGDPMVNKVLQKRAIKIDLDALDPITAVTLDAKIDEVNPLNAKVITITPEAIRALTVVIPKAVDPFKVDFAPEDILPEPVVAEPIQ